MTRHHTSTESAPGAAHAADDYWLTIFGDVDFPVNSAALRQHAAERKADRMILGQLKSMPDRTYKSIEEFRRVFGARLDNYGNTR